MDSTLFLLVYLAISRGIEPPPSNKISLPCILFEAHLHIIVRVLAKKRKKNFIYPRASQLPLRKLASEETSILAEDNRRPTVNSATIKLFHRELQTVIPRLFASKI